MVRNSKTNRNVTSRDVGYIFSVLAAVVIGIITSHTMSLELHQASFTMVIAVVWSSVLCKTLSEPNRVATPILVGLCLLGSLSFYVGTWTGTSPRLILLGQSVTLAVLAWIFLDLVGHLRYLARPIRRVMMGGLTLLVICLFISATFTFDCGHRLIGHVVQAVLVFLTIFAGSYYCRELRKSPLSNSWS
jgi:hypothetical protein